MDRTVCATLPGGQLGSSAANEPASSASDVGKKRRKAPPDPGIKMGDEVVVLKWGSAIARGRVVGKRRTGFYQVQTAAGEVLNARLADLVGIER